MMVGRLVNQSKICGLENEVLGGVEGVWGDFDNKGLKGNTTGKRVIYVHSS